MSRDVHRLQQAMARMLFDPAFVDAVRAGPVEGLTEAERALLVQPDPRAWGTDRFRRARAVHALIDEYPVTTAIIGVSAVDAFFSSPGFAATLALRGSLALDFGDWVLPQTGGVARLEQALARARRAEPRESDGWPSGPDQAATGRGDLATHSGDAATHSGDLATHSGDAPVLALRGSLAGEFAAWVRPNDGASGSLAQPLAQAAPAAPGAGAPAERAAALATRPGVEGVTLPGGLFAFYLEQRSALGPDPAATLAQRAGPCAAPPNPTGDPDPLLLERDATGQVQIGGASPALVALLAFTTTARPRAAVLGEARRLGCDPGEDAALIADLLADGLLVSIPG